MADGSKNRLLAVIDTQNKTINKLTQQLKDTKQSFKEMIEGKQQVIDSQKEEITKLNKTIKELTIKLKESSPQDSQVNDTQKTALDILNETVPELRALIAKNKSAISAKVKVESSVPIGFVYVQYCRQLEPKELWPNTHWKNISDVFKGLFFRAEGGQAGQFGLIQKAGQQSVSICAKNCEHGESEFCVKYVKIDDDMDEYPFIATGAPVKHFYPDGDISQSSGIKLRQNDEEIRPKNTAIRIWQRTA